jgi:transposase
METQVLPRKPYPTDVSDDEGAFAAPYLTLMTPDAPQRRHDLREIFNAVRWIVRAGAPWRRLPTNFPPWPIVHQQTQRWIKAGCFETMAHDLRATWQWTEGRAASPTGAMFDSATRQSTPESGARAGDDGDKRRKGSKVHTAVDTLGHFLALHVSPADVQDRDQVGALATAVQAATGQTVELAFVDQGYTGDAPAAAAEEQGIRLEVVKLPEAKRLRLAAAPLGRRALLRLGRPLPAAGQRL